MGPLEHSRYVRKHPADRLLAETLEHALWLMRLSYLRYALKTASDPSGMLEHESEELGLSLHLRSLLQ
ncbi:MAG TPA: hypothetical protein VKD23_21820 [Terriglobales bacterium]|nr:hypothetical protein [Terriglobales bacterium]